jgi:FRG domain-containing protein
MNTDLPFRIGDRGRQELPNAVVEAQVVEHEWFGTLMAPTSLRDLGEIVQLLAGTWGATGWRGHACLDWKIDSSLVRRVRRRSDQGGLIRDTPGELERVVAETEARLLGRARLAGHDRRGTLSDLELAALLQHHGAATRLLDCTTNAQIAMWFACRDHLDDWGVVMGFDMREVVPILTAEQRDRPILEIVDGLGLAAGLWHPAALSPRMPAQQGFFIFSAAVDNAWGSLIAKGDTLHETGNVPGMNLIAISPELKADHNAICEAQYGYTDERLFPDLDGWARAHDASAPFPRDFYDGARILP